MQNVGSDRCVVGSVADSAMLFGWWEPGGAETQL